MHTQRSNDSREPRLSDVAGRERGSTLAIALIALVPVVALVSAFYSRSVTELSVHDQRKATVRATMRALAAIEIARNEISNSTYAAAGSNDRIQQALAGVGAATLRPDKAGTGFLGFDVTNGEYAYFDDPDVSLLPANIKPFRLLRTIDLEDDQNGETDDASDKVSVYVVNLADTWHMVESRATLHGVTRTARMLVRERDPFTRFSIFINSHYMGVGGTPKGDIHTNRTLQIFYPDGVFEDYVSARDGFQYLVGASAANTSFDGGSAAPSDEIPMPNISEIQGLASHATGTPYYISDAYDNVEITFDRDEVKIRARKRSNGQKQTLHDGALPQNGVIYAVRNVSKLEGDVDGRVTVVSERDVKITGSIRYVDSDGDVARINPNDPENYTVNPNYDGSSAVGVIANQKVEYDRNVPNVLELHAAIFSSTGGVGLPGLNFTSNGAYVTTYLSTFQKQSLLLLGTTIADRRFVGTVVNGAGTVLSGFQDGVIEYDRDLLNNPPPHFLELDRPLFKAVEILESAIDV